MNRLTNTITALRPGVDFANVDNTLAGIRWDTLNVTPPTQAQVDAAMAVIEYQEKRRSEYPPLADLADAVVKEPTDGGVALDTYRAACLAVKAKYPKPSAD